MRVNIVKNGVQYYCTSEEQLNSFIADGWTVEEETVAKNAKVEKVTAPTAEKKTVKKNK